MKGCGDRQQPRLSVSGSSAQLPSHLHLGLHSYCGKHRTLARTLIGNLTANTLTNLYNTTAHYLLSPSLFTLAVLIVLAVGEHEG